jgi:hypothetical protein
VLRHVETDLLLFLGDPQPEDQVQDTEDHERRYERVAKGNADRERLRAKLARVAVDQAIGAGCIHRDSRENAGGYHAPGAAYAMHADDVQRVVEMETVAHQDSQVAEGARTDSDSYGRSWFDEARGGRNSGQTGNSAGADA